MLKDAELHAEEDKKKREEAEIRNEADSLVFRAEKALKEYHDKLPKDVIDDVQSKIDAAKKALESGDLRKSNTLRPILKATCSISAKRWPSTHPLRKPKARTSKPMPPAPSLKANLKLTIMGKPLGGF